VFVVLEKRSMAKVPDEWVPQLALALAAAVVEFRTSLENERIVCFDVSCFPWHGSIELSALTVAEFDADPGLLSPSEVAAWRFYNFSESSKSWMRTTDLLKWMSQAYYAAEDESRAAMAKEFMQGCLAAAVSPEVKAALSSLPRDPRFRVRVAHPDSGEEFEFPAG
jgi:hypothetical protein